MPRQDPGHESLGTDPNPQDPCRAGATETAMGGHLLRAKDERLLKRAVKSRAAIYEANLIAAAKANRAARKSRATRTRNPNTPALSSRSCRRPAFRAWTGLVELLRNQCNNPTTLPAAIANVPIVSPKPTSRTATTSVTSTGNHTPSTPTPQPTSSTPTASVIPVTTTTTTTTFPTLVTGENTHHASSTATCATSNVDSFPTCSHCDRTPTSRIGPTGHLRIHHIETGLSLPEAPNYTSASASTVCTDHAHSLKA
ncbi:hypothetical protein SprV_0301285400 [Sparganum proliferum]